MPHIRTAFARAAILVATLGLFATSPAAAHCDTLDGPVVAAAREALAAGDVTPVLPWVRAADESEIRAAFARALTVRDASDAARELADHYFFETLVRVHRASEGFPYAGLRPAGAAIDPAVRAADAALATGDVERLVTSLTETVADGLRERFERARAARAHADHDVESGRAWVAAYVNLTHYAEAIAASARGAAGHGATHDAAAAHD